MQLGGGAWRLEWMVRGACGKCNAMCLYNLTKNGVKVDVVRAQVGMVERGRPDCVMRRVVDRVCLDVLCCSASGRADLCMGGSHVLERKGVR